MSEAGHDRSYDHHRAPSNFQLRCPSTTPQVRPSPCARLLARGLRFAVTIALAAAPAPLYVLYAREDHFGSFATTVIFGVYALGVAVSLYLAGHISDRFGRRRIIAPAVLLNVIAALIFMTWHEMAWLLIARFISGLGIGMLAATATAHLTELHRKSRPEATPTQATVVSTVANIGGIGLGPLVSGFLAEWAPRPLYTPYAVFAFLMLAGLIAVVVVPETVEPTAGEWHYRPQKTLVHVNIRARFVAAATIAFVSFSMFGFFTFLTPSFIALNLGHTSHALAGAVSFAVFGSAALAQIASTGWAPARLYAIGLSFLPIGLVLTVAAVLSNSLGMIIAAGIIVGIGAGLGFKGAVPTVIAIAPPAARGESLALLFLAGYIGMSVPVIGLGVLLEYVAIHPAMVVFGLVMLALLAFAVGLISSGNRGASRSRDNAASDLRDQTTTGSYDNLSEGIVN